MLSYKKKINTGPPTSSIKMAHFDLYADLPVLQPVEQQDIIPDMTSQDIMTLRKKPFLVRAASPNGSSGSSSGSFPGAGLSVWTGGGGRPKGMEEVPVSNPVLAGSDLLQKRRGSRITELHKAENDCITFIPQNTAPMSKLRKNFTKKRIMKESEAEGVTTDELAWHLRKQQIEKDQISYIRRTSGIKDSHLKKIGKFYDFEDEDKVEEKLDRNLEEELSRPTYVPGADQEGPESLFTALGKSIPRTKIAFVNTVVQKIEKKKQEKKEREILAKIQKALAEHGHKDLEELKDANAEIEEISFPETSDLNQPTDFRNNNLPTISEFDEYPDVISDVTINQVDLTDLPEPVIEPKKTDLDQIEFVPKKVNLSPELPPPIQQPFKQDQMTSPKPLPRDVTEFIPVTSPKPLISHARSESNILSTLGNSRRHYEDIAPPPPSLYNHTSDMISYSELLMANAKHSDRSASAMTQATPGDHFSDLYAVDIDLEPSLDTQVYYLPPEADERANKFRSYTPSGGHVRRVKSKQGRPKSRAKKQAYRKQRKQSLSVKDLRVINRLESIVDRQNKIIDQMQVNMTSGEVPKRHKSLLNVVPVYSDSESEEKLEKNRPGSVQRVKQQTGSMTSLTISLTSLSSCEEKNKILTTFNDLDNDDKNNHKATATTSVEPDFRHKDSTSIISIPVPVINPQNYSESDIDDGLISKQTTPSSSRAPSRGYVKPRRRKSIIRLKGVKLDKKGENQSDLTEKVKEILAGSTNAVPGENWKVSWAQREPTPDLRRSKSFVKRMKGILGLKSPKQVIEDDVIAEIIHNEPDQDFENVELNPDTEDVEVKPKPQVGVPEPKAKPRKIKEDNTLCPPRSNTLCAQSSIPDGESSDVGPLPEIITSAKRRRSNFARSQLSVDSGFSTNPPDDENPELPNRNFVSTK